MCLLSDFKSLQVHSLNQLTQPSCAKYTIVVLIKISTGLSKGEINCHNGKRNINILISGANIVFEFSSPKSRSPVIFFKILWQFLHLRQTR